MPFLKYFTFILTIIGLSGCMTPPNWTKEEIHSRIYKNEKRELVENGVLRFLRDYGYSMNKKELDKGVIVATKQLRFYDEEVALLPDSEKKYKENIPNIKMEFMANIKTTSDETIHMEVDFKNHIFDEAGQKEATYQLDDFYYYYEFFRQVNKNIYVAKNSLSELKKK